MLLLFAGVKMTQVCPTGEGAITGTTESATELTTKTKPLNVIAK